MPIHLQENQYHGVNAHLHSYLQQHQDWSVFHGVHITHLREALQALLPPDTGYFVLSEKSLQVVRDDLVTGLVSRTRTIQDVGIYKSREGVTPGTGQAAAPGATISIVDTFTEPETVMSVVIRKVEAGETGIGKLITRIKLLSPANKPPGSHYPQYLTNRDDTLLRSINLVEIDYLHERRSQLAILPDHPGGEPGAYPYLILVSTPFPVPIEGKTDIYGFRVDDPIPTIAIPLDDGHSVTLDLGAVYDHTFTSNWIYGLRLVDYEKLPENFASYQEEDQKRIHAVMGRVTQAHQQSDELR